MKRLPQRIAVTLATLVVMSACKSIALAQLPAPQEPEMVGEKRCGHCNRVVPASAKAGDTCPFCGAQWVTEESKSFRSESVREHSTKSFSQKTRTSLGTSDGDQFEMTATKYAIVVAGLAIGTLIVVLTIRFLINNI